MAHNDGTGDDDSKRTFDAVGRRDVLKTTAAAAVAAGGLSGSASANYNTIQANGQTIHIDSGETWENVLIDMSTGNDIAISATGTNWTIRNIGIQGMDTSDIGRTYFGVADTGGNTSTIENVYIGDGSTSGNQQPTGHGTSGIWVSPDHSGHLDIRYVNVQGMADNGIYGSAPGSNSNGQRGTIHIDSCYASNCHVAQFRLADGCTVSNSVAFNDGSYQYNGRCFWGWPTRNGNRIEILDCDFDSGSYNNAVHLDGGTDGTIQAYMAGTQHDGLQTDSRTQLTTGSGNGNNPDLSVPAGVPTSAEQAASGDSGGDDDSIVGDDDAHYFEIEGPGEFNLEVDQEVEPDPEIADAAEYGTHYGDDWVNFTLTDTGETYWWFKNDVVELDMTDDQTAWIDGDEVGDGGDDGGTVIEDFDRDSPMDYYGGEDQLFSPTSNAYAAGQAIENDSGSFGSAVSMYSLDEFPERGDDVHVHLNNASDDNFVAVHLFAQEAEDNPDGYSIGISAFDGLTIWRNEDGDTDSLDSQDLGSSQISGWYRLEISTDSSTVSADLYDADSDDHLASVSASDSTYSSGGFGYRSAGNGEVFDYVVLYD